MSRRLLEKARFRLAAESGETSRPWGGRLSVALVYPNFYRHAMSNLGYQSVHHLINSREKALCERFFLPDPDDLEEHRRTRTPLFSLESGRLLTDFDLIAFSISFENDYLHLPVLFDLARIPLFSSERGEEHPLILCGGVCAFLNPEPLADIMDFFAVGEAEAILPDLLDELHRWKGSRYDLLENLALFPGIYVPSLYSVGYAEDGTVDRYQSREGAPSRVRRQWVSDLNPTESRTFIRTPEAEFSGMFLTELSRGCSRGCRFCAAGFLYLPPREREMNVLLEQMEEGLDRGEKIGLVGAAVSDYSQSRELNREILNRGGTLSPASLRIDSLTCEEVETLRKSEHRTVSLAPEAGSQRLRDLINKGLSEDQILEAVRLLGEGGIPNLKLYFLIGLPTEEQRDLEEMLELVKKTREIWREEGRKKGRLGKLTLSVNPFIPKPFTPLQWASMEKESRLKEKIRRLRSAVARLPNTEMIAESPREATLQAFFSRGDRRTARILPNLSSGTNLKAACRETGLDPDFYTTRERGPCETFPWEILDSGVPRDYLWKEYKRALEGKSTPRCTPECRRCGICG